MQYSLTKEKKVVLLRFIIQIFVLIIICDISIAQPRQPSSRPYYAPQTRLKLIYKPSDKSAVIAVINQGVSNDDSKVTISNYEVKRKAFEHLSNYGYLYKMFSAPEYEYSFSGFNRKYNYAILQQKYNGIPVFGSKLKIKINNNNEVRHSSGNYLKITPNRYLYFQGVTSHRAKMIVMNDIIQSHKNLSAKSFDFSFIRSFINIMEAKLVIYNEDFLKTGIPSDSNKRVWMVSVVISEGEAYTYIISALNGKILDKIDAMHYFNPPQADINSCDYAYGCSCNAATSRRGSDPIRNAHPLYGNHDVDNIFDMLTQAHSYYLYEFDRDGANGYGGMGDGINISLTENRAYANYNACDAIRVSQGQNPKCINGTGAFYNPNGTIGFCAGSPGYDVLGHEYSHAFADSLDILPLNIQSQAAIINEAIADFFGEDLEYFWTNSYDGISGTGTNLFGARSLRDPSLYAYKVAGTSNYNPFPDNFNSATYYCDNGDNFNQYNSTVLSHAFYIAAVGGNFNCCSIDGIGFPKTIGIIHYTMENYMSQTTNFNEFYANIETACSEYVNSATNYYYVTQDDCNQMLKALQSAEINLPGGCIGNQPAKYNHVVSCAVYPPGNNSFGDYNNNWFVDDGDYAVWRKNYSCRGVNVPGDGNGDGSVDTADYTVLRDHYGLPVPQYSPAPEINPMPSPIS